MAATAQMSITAVQCVGEYAVCMTSIVPTFLRRRVSAFNCKRDGVVRDAEVYRRAHFCRKKYAYFENFSSASVTHFKTVILAK